MSTKRLILNMLPDASPVENEVCSWKPLLAVLSNNDQTEHMLLSKDPCFATTLGTLTLRMIQRILYCIIADLFGSLFMV